MQTCSTEITAARRRSTIKKLQHSHHGPGPEIKEIVDRLKDGNFDMLRQLVNNASLSCSDCRAVLNVCAGCASLRPRCSKSLEYLIQRVGKEQLSKPDESGDTPAHLASRSGNLMLLALLPNEAKFSSNSDGVTPLMEAARCNKMRCAKHLMHRFRQKPPPDNMDWQSSLLGHNANGQTALDIARESGWSDLANVIEAELTLLKSGLTPEQEKERKNLEDLALKGDIAELKLRVTSANCDLPDGGGKTLLMRVAEHESAGLTVLKFLVDLGDPTAVDANGWTSMHSAAAAGWNAAVQELARAGATVNCADRLGLTPLMQAAKSQKGAVETLLELDANWELRDAQGVTALYMADSNRMTANSRLLSPHYAKSFYDGKAIDAAPSTSSEFKPALTTASVRAPEKPDFSRQEGTEKDQSVFKMSALVEDRSLPPISSTSGTCGATAEAAPQVPDVTETCEAQTAVVSADSQANAKRKSFMQRLRITGDPIGRGAFGTVYLASVEGDPHFHCAKFICLPFNQGDAPDVRNSSALSAIEAELTLCYLEHENIVKFFGMDYDKEKSEIIVAMEFVDGKALFKFVQCKPLEVDLIRRLSAQICSALKYMHKRRVIHRDLNGNNILIRVTSAGSHQVKLIDFGLSRRLRGSATHCQESGSQPKGVMSFIAPEQFGYKEPQADGSEADAGRFCPKSDIWSFGCIVYFMATGSVPYPNIQTVYGFGKKISEDGAPPLNSQCDSQLTDFYAQCTHKNYASRWSAAELMKHPFLEQPSVTANPSDSSTDSSSRSGGDGGCGGGGQDRSRDQEPKPSGSGRSDSDGNNASSGGQGSSSVSSSASNATTKGENESGQKQAHLSQRPNSSPDSATKGSYLCRSLKLLSSNLIETVLSPR